MDNTKTEELIALVQKYAHLYDARRPDYKDVVKKDNSWSEIAVLLGEPAKECQQRWKLLRDNYTRELRKMKKKSGSARTSQPKWLFFEQMSFLNDFVRPRKAFENTTNLPNVAEMESGVNSDDYNLSQENVVENIQFPCASKQHGDGESPSKKRSRNHGRHLEELIIKELERPMEDKYDHFGKYVAGELRSIANPAIEHKMMTAIHEIFLRLNPQDNAGDDIFQMSFSQFLNDSC